MADREIKIIANTQVRGQAALSGALSDIERKLKALIGQAGQANQAFQKLLGPGRPGVAGLLGTGNNQDATKPIKQLGQAHQDTTNKILKNNRDLVKSYQDLAKAQALAGFGGGEQGLTRYGAMSRFQGYSRTRAFTDVSGLLGPAQGIGRYQGGALEPDQVFPGPRGGQRLLGAGDGGGRGPNDPWSGGNGIPFRPDPPDYDERNKGIARKFGAAALIANTGASLIQTLQDSRNAEAHNIASSHRLESEALSDILSTGLSPKMILLAQSKRVQEAVNKAKDDLPFETIGKEALGDIGNVAAAAGGGMMLGGPPGAAVAGGAVAVTSGAKLLSDAVSQKNLATETMRRAEALDLQAAMDPMALAGISQIAAEAPSRLQAERMLKGRAAQTTQGYYGYGIDEITGMQAGLAGQAGLNASGMAPMVGRLGNLGINSGSQALGSIFQSLGGGANNVDRSTKLMEDVLTRAVTNGFTDSKTQDVLTAALGRAVSQGPVTEEGMRAYAGFLMQGAEGKELTPVQAQARTDFLPGMEGISKNPLIQAHTMTYAKQVLGNDFTVAKGQAILRSSPEDMIHSSALLQAAGVSLEQSNKIEKLQLRDIANIGGVQGGTMKPGDALKSPENFLQAVAAWGIKGNQAGAFADFVFNDGKISGVANQKPEDIAKTFGFKTQAGDIKTAQGETRDSVVGKGQEAINNLQINGKPVDLKEFMKDIITTVMANTGENAKNANSGLLDKFTDNHPLPVRLISSADPRTASDASAGLPRNAKGSVIRRSAAE